VFLCTEKEPATYEQPVDTDDMQGYQPPLDFGQDYDEIGAGKGRSYDELEMENRR